MSVSEEQFYEVHQPRSVGLWLMIKARSRIYSDFIDRMQPTAASSIIDVGVSDTISTGANLIERYYPRLDNLTACGLDECSGFKAAYPTVRYQRIDAHARLPFRDHEFDIAVSNAVLEHAGGYGKQVDFISELARIARRVFITVPNRFFPFEHHTAIPFLHYADRTFRLACAVVGKPHWAKEENLILMSRRRIAALVPPHLPFTVGYTGLKLGPLSSNLFLIIN